MKCNEVTNQLLELLYGELTSEQESVVRKHLAQCPSCQSEFNALSSSRRLLDRAPQPVEPTRVDIARIYESAAARAELSRRRWQRFTVAAGVVVATLLVLTGSGLRFQAHPTHVVIGWGPSAVEKPIEQPPTPPNLEPVLKKLSERLDGLSELTNLATRELIDTDNRRSAEIAALFTELRSTRQQFQQQLKHLEVRGDLRWQLIRHDLSQPTVQNEHAEIDPARINE